jgi:glycosyltransferase involved in cell wall biosynthesis
MCKVDKTDFTLSVVVPIYNEARTLQPLLDAVRSAPFKKQIILVDDGSNDASRAIWCILKYR